MGSQTKTKTCACKNETEQEKLSRIAEVIEEYRDREGSLATDTAPGAGHLWLSSAQCPAVHC